MKFVLFALCTHLITVKCCHISGLPKYIHSCLSSYAGANQIANMVINEFEQDMANRIKENDSVDEHTMSMIDKRLNSLAVMMELPVMEMLIYSIKYHASFTIIDRKRGYHFDAGVKRHEMEVFSDFLFQCHRTMFHLEQLEITGSYGTEEIDLIRERYHSNRLHFQFLICYRISESGDRQTLMSLFDVFSAEYFRRLSFLLDKCAKQELDKIPEYHESWFTDDAEVTIRMTIGEPEFAEQIKKNAKPFTPLHLPMDAFMLLSRLSSQLGVAHFASFIKSMFLGLHQLDVQLMRNIQAGISYDAISRIELATESQIIGVISGRLDFEFNFVSGYVEAFARRYRLYSILKLCGVDTISQYCLKQHEFPISQKLRKALIVNLKAFMESYQKVTGEESEYRQILKNITNNGSIGDILQVPNKHDFFYGFCVEHGFADIPPVLGALKDGVCFEHLIPSMNMADRAHFLMFYYQLRSSLMYFVQIVSFDVHMSKSVIFEGIENIGERTFEAGNGVLGLLNRLQNLIPLECVTSPQHQLVADVCKLVLTFMGTVQSIAYADLYFDVEVPPKICGWSENLISSLSFAIGSKAHCADEVESINLQKSLIEECKNIARKWHIHSPMPHDGLLLSRLLQLWKPKETYEKY